MINIIFTRGLGQIKFLIAANDQYYFHKRTWPNQFLIAATIN